MYQQRETPKEVSLLLFVCFFNTDPVLCEFGFISSSPEGNSSVLLNALALARLSL